MTRWYLRAVPALLLVVACSSQPRRRVKRAAPVESTALVETNPTKRACTTVLDCIRGEGSPPPGMKWSCEMGVCESADVGSRPIASE